MLRITPLAVLAGAAALIGCSTATAPDAGSMTSANPEAEPKQEVTGGGPVPISPPPSEEPGWKMTTVASGLPMPWAIEWLPDGRALVTLKDGRLATIKDGEVTIDGITGAPETSVIGQGGLMDVSLHPKFAENGYVYFTHAIGNSRGNRTALSRGVLRGNQITGLREIYRVNREKQGGQHFGSRIEWLDDGTFLMSIGDGGNPPSSVDGEFSRFQAQRYDSHMGHVVRLDENGRAPKDNPWVNKEGASPENYSMGHRNIQGLARDPESGRVWANEHGARGGDELNEIKAGANYGWPLVTYSIEYSGQPITDERSRPGLVDPMIVWTPCPAPSALLFYTGDRFPGWKGDLFSAGLAGQDVRRIDLDENGKLLGQTRLNIKTRVRDVRQGPDGYIYILTDERDGKLIRLESTRG